MSFSAFLELGDNPMFLRATDWNLAIFKALSAQRKFYKFTLKTHGSLQNMFVNLFVLSIKTIFDCNQYKKQLLF